MNIFFSICIAILSTLQVYSQTDFVIKDLNLSNLNDFSNYEVFDSLLKDKNIVFLGESGHSGHEYNEVKLKLIKFLNEKHGYDVVLFESGIADCYYGNTNKTGKDSLWFMTNSIYPIWFSEPTLNLMDYIEENKLDIAGIDYKRSYGKRNIASKFIKDIKIEDKYLLNSTYNLDSTFFSQIYGVNFTTETDRKKLDYLITIADSLKSNYKTLLAQIGDTDFLNDKNNDYFVRIIKNKQFYLDYFDKPDKLSQLRDSVMSSNIMWYYDYFYKGRKIIVWAANDHIGKEVSKYNENYYAGSILPDRIKDSGYFIGIYAYSGKMYDSSRGSDYEISKPKKKSIEAKSHEYFDNENNVFLDISSKTYTKKNKWKGKKMTSYVWGKIPVKLIPEDYYDGIILINNLTISR